MRLLKELVDIVTRQRVEKVQTIDINELEDQQSQYAKFYNGLRNGNIKSDQEAAAFFYKSDTSDDRYRKLKSRFKKRMLNYLFFLDINSSSFSDYAHAKHTCNKNLFLCRILKVNGGRFSFEKLAKQTLTQAQKYQLYAVIVPLTTDLLTHYSLYRKNNEYYKVLAIHQTARKELDAEYEAERLMEEVVLFVNSPKGIPIGKQNTLALETLKQEFPTNYRLNYLRLYTAAIYYQITFDFEKLIETCNEAEAFYEQHTNFYQTNHLGQFSIMRMVALLNLRDTDNGLRTIKKSLKYFIVGKNNWLLTMESYFLLAMQAQRYNLASEIFLQAVNHPRFKYASDIRKEKWRIFHAYLHYIYEVDKLDKRLLKNKYIPNFNASQFLNNTTDAAKHKSGLNMAIITLQIQYLLKDHDLDAIFDKMDALNIYAYRYLNRKENTRAYTYIKMLYTAEKKSFIHKQVLEETKDLHASLHTAIDNYSAEWEVLPYEVMWTHALRFIAEAEAANG